MKQKLLIDSSKIGSISIFYDDIKKFIIDNFDIIVFNGFRIKDMQINQRLNNLIDIVIILNPPINKDFSLEDVRSTQNHLASFITSNLGIDTKSVTVGIDL